jgi:hypothetical protein
MRLTKTTLIIYILGLICHSSCSQHSQELAKPSPVQYDWHEQERIMFIHYGPATWQGREYDDLSTPLERINPRALDKFVSVDENIININRTAQVTEESKIIVNFRIEASEMGKGVIQFRPGLIY